MLLAAGWWKATGWGKQHGYSVCIRTVLCSESEGCWWGQRLSQDVVICILARWSGSSFDEHDPNGLCKGWTELSWSSVRQIQAEATDSHKIKKHVVCSYTTSTEYYSLWQEKHWAGFHNRALAHTHSCRFMSGKQHTKSPFLCMIQCSLLFSSNYLGNIHDRSKKGMDYFFAVIFNLIKKRHQRHSTSLKVAI